MIVSDDRSIEHEYACPTGAPTERPALRVRSSPFRMGRVLLCGPAGRRRADPCSVAEADTDRADHLILAQRLVAVAEAEVLDTAMHVPRPEPRRRAGERHGRDRGEAEEAEPLVAAEGFVVVAETEPDL